MAFPKLKPYLKRTLPRPLLYLYRFSTQGDAGAVILFLCGRKAPISLIQRWWIIKKLYLISDRVDCPHLQKEILAFIIEILNIPEDKPGVVVEAGCYQGGSTAKFSMALHLTGRKMVVFDSFAGLPEHREIHSRNIFGEEVRFDPGDYRANLLEVRKNLSEYGEPASCELIPGWFEDTLPAFSTPVAAAFIDVDLASSTRTCLKFLFPLLVPGGVIYSHDGHIPRVIKVLEDDDFWKNEVGMSKPAIVGLGKRKLLKIVKPEKNG